MPSNPNPKFEEAFAAFFAGCQRIHEDYMAAHFPNNPREAWRSDSGPKFVRVVHGNSAFCFVNRENGDVLKTAGWKGPEKKNPRGNIYDDKNGLGLIGPYGPAYIVRGKRPAREG